MENEAMCPTGDFRTAWQAASIGQNVKRIKTLVLDTVFTMPTAEKFPHSTAFVLNTF
jgi:hypothetical protein